MLWPTRQRPGEAHPVQSLHNACVSWFARTPFRLRIAATHETAYCTLKCPQAIRFLRAPRQRPITFSETGSLLFRFATLRCSALCIANIVVPTASVQFVNWRNIAIRPAQIKAPQFSACPTWPTPIPVNRKLTKRGQTKSIGKNHRVAGSISIDVHPPLQSNRIGLHIPPTARIIIPEVVVERPH